jgi:hypothetical protein
MNLSSDLLKYFKKEYDVHKKYCDLCNKFTFHIDCNMYYDPKNTLLHTILENNPCTICFAKTYNISDHCCRIDEDIYNSLLKITYDKDIKTKIIRRIVNAKHIPYSNIRKKVLCDICYKHTLHHSIKLPPVSPKYVKTFKQISDIDDCEINIEIQICYQNNDNSINFNIQAIKSWDELNFNILYSDNESKIVFESKEQYEKSNVYVNNDAWPCIILRRKSSLNTIELLYCDPLHYQVDLCIPCFNSILDIPRKDHFEFIQDKHLWSIENHIYYPERCKDVILSLLLFNKYRLLKHLKVPKYILHDIIRYYIKSSF